MIDKGVNKISFTPTFTGEAMSQIQRFMAAFEGSDAAHGQTNIGSQRRNGKTEAKSFVVREPMTEQSVKDHIEGKQGLGAIPINRENKCKFAAIDIDTYPIDHKELVAKLAFMQIPMIVCRSKSGGAHLFMFLDDWYPAAEIREYLIEIASAIGHSGCEIFPKQDKILADRGDVGNFINLPYFDAEQTVRYAVDMAGDNLELDDFLDWVDQNRLALSDLEKVDFGTQREFMADGPPCLQVIVSTGAMEGVRNKVMFNFGVYLKMKYPDEWQSRFEEANAKYCKPKLPASEIVTLQKQIERKDYFYQCNEEPLCSYCNKSLCKRRKFGVNSGADVEMPHIGGLTILLSEPRLYFLDIDGHRLELSTRQLQMPIKFQEACMEQTKYMPPLMKSADWQVLVNGLLKDAAEIEVPEELTISGQFKELVKTFAMSRIRARSPEELEMGKPWTEEGKTYFKIKGLQEYLKNQGFTMFSRPQMQRRLEEMNSDGKCNGFFKYKNEKGVWKNVRVWWIPEVVQEETVLPVEEVYEAPF